ncbi:MAG: vWA domain-containing protein [Candidatus Obscuribacterales bacterium]
MHSFSYRHLVTLAFVLAASISLLLPWQDSAPAYGQVGEPSTTLSPGPSESAERPINYIFLIDVSGSMVSKRTMVTGAGGKQVTLFEALRDALRAIVNDERVIPPNSKLSFITFGTAIEPKSDWPASIASPDDRTQLVAHISNNTELQADKHGDTYMAGALDSAYTKIEELTKGADPCATTFVVMLTDGWDEPPPGASLKVKDVARTFVDKQRALTDKLGVNTLQVRVIGLQRLPDRKAGTTTAKELATILGGDFLDVTTEGGSTVANRIYRAVQKTIADLRAKIDIADAASGGLADFGEIKGAQSLTEIKAASRSCYPEKVTGLSDETPRLTPAERQKVLTAVKQNGKSISGPLQPASTLPSGMMKVHLKESQYELAPAFKQKNNNASWQPIELVAEVDPKCQPGNYFGAVRLVSTALVPELVCYCVTVPSRILFEETEKQTAVRKPGFFFPEPTSTKVPLSINARVGKKVQSDTKVVLTPQPAQFVPEKHHDAAQQSATIQPSQINGGKPFETVLEPGDTAKVISIPVAVPADQPPGLYRGVFKVRIDGDSSMKSVDEIPYAVRIQPSAWEEISPIAIPLIALLTLMLVLGFILTVARLRR